MKNIGKIKWVFLAMFFFSMNVAITGYINSSFIESLGWSATILSGTYILSAILALLLLPKMNRFANRIGNRKLMLTLLAISIISLFFINFIQSPIIQLTSFLMFLTFNFLIIFEMDVFVEHFSEKENTGKIRGIFFTIINLTWALSPLAAGIILDTLNNNSIIYIIGIICVISSFLIFSFNFKKTIFEKKEIHSTKSMISRLGENSDLRNAFSISGTLHLVYAISMIYIPLHLHSVIGLSWTEIGALVLIGNIPYLIFGYVIGYIADTYIGEKEMMITGLIITALGTLGFIFIKEPHFWAWVIVFFISRIGLTLIETTTESFIFKKIEHDDIEMLSMERNAIPLGYLIAPLVGFISSLFTESYIPIFITLAILLIINIYPALKLKDTK